MHTSVKTAPNAFLGISISAARQRDDADNADDTGSEKRVSAASEKTRFDQYTSTTKTLQNNSHCAVPQSQMPRDLLQWFIHGSGA